jgi:glucose-6-phosphate-specific signal transduction histidine kinase
MRNGFPDERAAPMNSGILPLLLLGMTLGLALSTASAANAWRAWLAAAVVALTTSFMTVASQHLILVEIVLWLTVVMTATVTYWPERIAARAIVPLAVNAGVWLGAVAAASAMRPAMLAGLTGGLLFLPVQALASRGSAIAVKVVASWMIAIGALAIFVSMVPTPGYKQDHME